MKTNESKRSATRSIFARIFSRQSSTERDTVAASESAAAAMSRLEKRGDEDASVLGLQRAERRDETADASASSSSPRSDVPLSASSAAARGMGTASAPIVVRPTATREEALLAQQPASATLPQEARAMYESEMYPQQDFVQQDFAQSNASADNPAYAPLHEPIETPSYPEGFSPQDFEAAIVAVRNAEAAGMNDLPYRDNGLVENVADNAPAATLTALNANLSADVTTYNASYTNAHAGVEAAVEAVAASAVESRIASDIPAFVEAPNLVAAAALATAPATAPAELSSPAPVNETKPSGMSFGPAHYTAQTRLKGMSTGQSTGHGVPFLHVAPNLQGAVHTPAFESASASATSSAASASFVAPAQAEVAADVAPQAALVQASTVETISAAPVAVTAPVSPVSAPVSDAPMFTANDVPAIDLGEVAEVMAATQTVEAANLMETAHTSREAEAATVTTASAAPATAAPFSATPSAAATPASEANHPRVIAGKVLSEMRTLCGTLGEQLDALESQSTVRPDPTRVAMTRMLLGCGFSAQLVRLLLARMPVVADAEQGLAWVKATFERNLPVLDNEDALMEQGGVFALMGPTGVGKTTTTAKLAARAVMRHGADRVALLTTDSYRIGAHEQLRIYGRILGVAVHAVKDAADLSLVLSELRNKHMVLIDTIGMSQRDRAVSEQVSMLCGSHLPVKRLLLLNATSHGDTLNEVVRAYGTRDGSNGAASGLSGCIITKVDESHGIGAALDTVMRHRLPVHYVSNGQKVPEDLRVARRGFLIDNAFSERHRASPFQPDEDDLSMIFGEEGEAASMLSSGAGLTSASSANASNAASAVAQASEAHYG
jgi:flagellar biosynthesis protein FlhF